MKDRLARQVVGLFALLLMLGHAGGLYEIGVIKRLDAIVYDVMIDLTLPRGVEERIVIVDIDERALAEVGRWPWGRDRMAALVDSLFESGRVALVGFAVVFPEPDDSSGLRSLDRLAENELRDEPAFQTALGRLRPRLDHDARFAEALRGRPVILGYYLSSREQDASTGSLPLPVLPVESLANSRVTHWTSFGGNLSQFQRNAMAAGHFNPMLDDDGVARRVPLLVEHEGNCYEALSLATVRAYLGSPRVVPVLSSSASQAAIVERLELKTVKGSLPIPVDENLAALVPYRGGQGSFPYVSAADVLAGRVPPEQLRGKIMLVGTTALGLADLRATPVSTAFPGVEIHANLIAGMLDGRLKHQPGYLRNGNVVLLVAIGLAAIILLPRLSPFVATAMALAVLLALICTYLVLWYMADMVLPIAAAVTLLALLYSLNMSWGYFVESRAKRQFATLFGQYVPPELVEEMTRNPEGYSMVGQRKELTVLFSDIRGFTSMSEGMPPDRLAALLNEYFGAMTEVVRHWRGTLDKYIGDAIMAFWGAPVEDGQHARHAVQCAIEMQATLGALAQHFVAQGWPPLRIGVGINTGPMTVGDMGSPVRKAYTVLGDAVNLAWRLQGITKEYGVGIIVGEQTRDALATEFLFRELDRIRVKGKEDSVTIFEPITSAESATAEQREEIDAWHRVLQAYRAQDWEVAARELRVIARTSPRPLYDVFGARIARCRTTPPAREWDGVWIFENK